MEDVAQAAGVSSATASRALNNRTEVHPETRAQVQLAAARLGFFKRTYKKDNGPSPAAKTIGLVTSDPGGRFSMQVLAGAENSMDVGSIEVLLCSTRNDIIRENHYVNALAGRKVDGIIVVGSWTNHRAPLPISGIPTAYVMSPSQDESDLSFVPDDYQGGCLAARHLLTLGRTRIAVITGPELWKSSRDRALGAVDTGHELGVELVEQPLYGSDWTRDWGRSATEMLLRKHSEVDAILCGSDQIADGALQTLLGRGMRVPADISVMGYDNWSPFCEDNRPRLTSIDMNIESLGRQAALSILRPEAVPFSGVFKQPPQLIIRESTVPLTESTGQGGLQPPEDRQEA